MPLSEYVVGLAKGPNLASVVTLMPDGQPQAQLTWIDTDGDNLLVNTEPQRQRAKNVTRDPRVTVLIHVASDPFAYAEIRGVVSEVVGGQRARDHIDELSQRYVGAPYSNPIAPEGRIILVVRPEKVNEAPH